MTLSNSILSRGCAGNDGTTRLTTTVNRYKLLKAFHDGIVEFIRNEYCPSKWRRDTDLGNIDWMSLLNVYSVPGQNWQKRLAIYGDKTYRVSKVDPSTCYQLTQQDKEFVILRQVLNMLATLSAQHKNTEAQLVADLFRSLPVDIALGEVNQSWYLERLAELQTEYGFDDYFINGLGLGSSGLEDFTRDGAKTRLQKRIDDRNRCTDMVKARLQELKLGQVVDGTVRRIKKYGLFVDIGGRHALLYISTISQLPVEHPNQVFQFNDWVKAMIIWLGY